MFKDRIQAGKLLALKLQKYKNEAGVVLAVPRGGVPVGYQVARELGFPLEVVLTKKIGHPNHKEYAIGAASLTDYFVLPHRNIPPEYIERELVAIRTRLKEMYGKFMGDAPSVNIKGKTVIIIDDGIATGNTILGTIRLIRQGQPGKIVIGSPVASKESVQRLAKEADAIVTVFEPEEFYGVGAFYKNFNEVSDDEVMFYLEKLARLKKAG
ncbi:phosphoribosyltransferase [Mucilaginibacter puniceus]